MSVLGGGKPKPGPVGAVPTLNTPAAPTGLPGQPAGPPAAPGAPSTPAPNSASAVVTPKTNPSALAYTTGAKPPSTAPAAGAHGTMAPAGNNMNIRLAAMQGVTLSAKASAAIATHLPLTRLSSVNTRGAAGAVFDLDAGKVAGLHVNLRRIAHPENGPGYEINLKLRTPADISAALAALDGKATTGRFELQPMAEENGALVITTPPKYTGESSYGPVAVGTGVQLEGVCHTLKGNGFQVDVMADEGAPQALRGKVRIRVYGADDAALGKHLKACINQAGLKDALAPSDILAQARMDRMRMLWQAAPEKAAAMFATAGTTELSALEAALHDSGVSPEVIAGAFRKEVFPGHVTTMNPAQAEVYKQLGVEFVFAGVGTADAIVGVLKSNGMMSSDERMTRGILVTGASTWEDFRTGGADYAFTRMVTKDAAGLRMDSAPMAGSYQVAFKPDILARTDWFAYPSDSYGNTKDPALFDGRLYGKALVDAIATRDGGFSTSNEVMFQRGISNDDIMAIFTQTEARRTALLDSLKKAGITRVAGKPVEELVVVRTRMVDMTPDLMVKRFTAALAGHCAKMSPEVEKFLRDTAAMPGKLDMISDQVQNLQWSSPEDVLQTVATQAGTTAPALILDVALLQDLARTQLEAAGNIFSPEAAAFFAKVDFAKIPPGTVKEHLNSLHYSGAPDVLKMIATPCGITDIPTIKANADTMVTAFKTQCVANGLHFTPELEGFVRALVDKGASAFELNEAVGSLSYQSETEGFKALADQWSLQPPPLSVNLEVVTATVREAVAQAGYKWTAEFDAYLQNAVQKGAPPYAIKQLGMLSYNPPKEAFAAITKETGLEPFKLPVDADGLCVRAKAAFEETFYTWTPQLEAFIRNVASNGALSQIRNMLDNLSYSEPEEGLKEAAKAASVTEVPPLVYQLDKLLEASAENLAAAHVILSSELVGFFQAVLDKGVSGTAVAECVQRFSYDGARGPLEDLAQKADLTAPKVAMNLESLNKAYQERFETMGVPYTPALRVFMEEAVNTGKGARDPGQWANSLSETDVGSMLKALGTEVGVEPPQVAHDPALLQAAYTHMMTDNGYKMSPAWSDFLDKVQQAGMPPHQILNALQSLSWKGPQAFAAYPALTVPQMENTLGEEEGISVMGEPEGIPPPPLGLPTGIPVMGAEEAGEEEDIM